MTILSLPDRFIFSYAMPKKFIGSGPRYIVMAFIALSTNCPGFRSRSSIAVNNQLRINGGPKSGVLKVRDKGVFYVRLDSKGLANKRFPFLANYQIKDNRSLSQ